MTLVWRFLSWRILEIASEDLPSDKRSKQCVPPLEVLSWELSAEEKYGYPKLYNMIHIKSIIAKWIFQWSLEWLNMTTESCLLLIELIVFLLNYVTVFVVFCWPFQLIASWLTKHNLKWNIIPNNLFDLIDSSGPIFYEINAKK